MARQRMVKPEFFDSESMAKCSIAARLAYIGLWVMADDEGRLKYQPNRLKTRIFPYDKMTAKRFASLLVELEAVGSIVVYTVDGEMYLAIPHFRDYQYIKKPTKSVLPEYQKRYSTPLVAHEYPTSGDERKKEKKKGMLLSNNNNIPKEKDAADAVACEPAPPSSGFVRPVCPICGTTIGLSFMDGNAEWTCPEHGKVDRDSVVMAQ